MLKNVETLLMDLIGWGAVNILYQKLPAKRHKMHQFLLSTSQTGCQEGDVTNAVPNRYKLIKSDLVCGE